MRSEGVLSISQQKTPGDVGSPLKGEKDVNTTALDDSGMTDGALYYGTYVTFGLLRSPVLNDNHYPESKKPF